MEFLIDRYEDKWKEPTVKTGARALKRSPFPRFSFLNRSILKSLDLDIH